MEGRCPACGTPTEPGQEYCLDCGTRITGARRAPGTAAGRAWERMLGWYPGDWIWASLLTGLVAAGSAAAAIATRTERGGNAAATVVATSPVVAAPVAPPAPKPRPKPARPAKRKSQPTVRSWPARDGYTVVVSSIPARGNGRAEAKDKAEEALSVGLRDVGVLTSSRFASLHPGYYVVFAGVYDSLQEAQTAARRISSKFARAYAREIAR